MMKLGFTPLNAQILDLDEAFKLASELGLQFVELSFDAFEVLPAIQSVQKVKELTRATGIGTTVHLSYVDLNIASLMPGVRENSVARTNRGLEYAAEIGAMLGVLHSGLIPLRHELMKQFARQKLEQSLSEITPLVPVMLENLALDGFDLLRGVSELEALTQLAGEHFGNCLDVGHALVEGCTTERSDGSSSGGIENGLKRLAEYQTTLSKLQHLHLQDNYGTSDAHQVLGTGAVPWQTMRDFLRNFSGTINLEINGGSDEVRSSVQFLRELLA
jgi:sugar phosphate isomerase/epimerase